MTAVRVIPDIAYAPAHGERGRGDLYLPERPRGAPAALVIHGGGWQSMDKRGLAGVAQFLAERGWGAFAINYRLIDSAPWPACGEDCLAAAAFVREAGHAGLQPLRRERLLVVGGSAGGHLALMTGLRLPAEEVRAIVSIAGPTDLRLLRDPAGAFRAAFWGRFFGIAGAASEADLLAASPVSRVRPGAPPLLCVHSVNDRLVPMEQSERIAALYAVAGARAELFSFAGEGAQHGIWVAGSDPHRLLPDIEARIAGFLATLTDMP
jgi:acetyl esterase/lipase